MSYLRHACTDKGHVCPSTAVEGTDAIRLYRYVPARTGHGSAGSVPHFISPLMIPQNKLYVPNDSAVFGAALLSQCFLPVRVSNGTARTSDRWQLSVSRREKEEPIVVMIFFSSHLLFETCKRPGTKEEYQLYRLRYLRAEQIEKKRPCFFLPFRFTERNAKTFQWMIVAQYCTQFHECVESTGKLVIALMNR